MMIVCILLEYIIVNVILGYILNTLIKLILIIADIKGYMEIEYYAGLKTAGNKISEYKVLSGLNIVSSLIVWS